jgi:hypothetical protein
MEPNTRASLDFAGFLDRCLRSTIRHSSRNASGGEHGGDRICGLEATPEPKTILLSDCGAERS